MPRPRQVGGPARGAAPAASRGPRGPGRQLTVHGAVHRARHLRVAGGRQVRAVPRRHGPAVSAHAPRAAALVSWSTAGVSYRLAAGPGGELPGVAPAAGVGHARAALQLRRAGRGGRARGAQHGPGAGLAGGPGALQHNIVNTGRGHNNTNNSIFASYLFLL